MQLSIIAALVAIGSPVVSRADAAEFSALKEPCELSSEQPVRKVFKTSFDSVTNGRGPLRSTCTYLAMVVDPCVLSIQVGVTVKPYKSRNAATTAYNELSAANQSLPRDPDAVSADQLQREDLPEIGNGAYYTTARGGSVVFVDGKRVVGLIGGFGVSDKLPTCPDPAEVAAENKQRLTALAARIAP